MLPIKEIEQGITEAQGEGRKVQVYLLPGGLEMIVRRDWWGLTSVTISATIPLSPGRAQGSS